MKLRVPIDLVYHVADPAEVVVCFFVPRERPFVAVSSFSLPRLSSCLVALPGAFPWAPSWEVGLWRWQARLKIGTRRTSIFGFRLLENCEKNQQRQ